MSVLPINCEIVELQEKYESECNNIFISTTCGRQKQQLLRKHSFEDDIDKLFNKASESSQRPCQKSPMRSASPRVYGPRCSDSVSLKQALRGLCISQASEMAAVRKRSSRSSASDSVAKMPKRQNGSGPVKSVFRGEIPAEGNEGSKEKCGTSSNSKNCIIIDDEWSEANSTSGSSTPSQNSRNMRWNSISAIEKQQGKLQMDHMNVLRKIRNGDISAVYLCRLKGISGGCFFSMKVMDVDVLRRRNQLQRAETEVEILKMLHHPFLPALYAHFTTGKLICLVMDHFPGGDLRSLRLKQRSNRFSEKAARFYVAEILVALEYLHILGIVYRNLKPENVLISEDGHIVLSSFDSSIKSAASCPSFRPSSPENSNGISSSSQFGSSCIMNPCRIPCFISRHKSKPELLNRISSLPPPVTGSTTTHDEYDAPELTIGGEGNCRFPADWWSLGVVLYELLYGEMPPFKGSTGDEATWRSIRFPETTAGVSSGARDLMRRLLRKEADKRIGAVRGAAEIKAHPFFHGVNWALIRGEMPPEVPKFV